MGDALSKNGAHAAGMRRSRMRLDMISSVCARFNVLHPSGGRKSNRLVMGGFMGMPGTSAVMAATDTRVGRQRGPDQFS